MVSWTRPIVTLYVHCLSCFQLILHLTYFVLRIHFTLFYTFCSYSCSLGHSPPPPPAQTVCIVIFFTYIFHAFAHNSILVLLPNIKITFHVSRQTNVLRRRWGQHVFPSWYVPNHTASGYTKINSYSQEHEEVKNGCLNSSVFQDNKQRSKFSLIDASFRVQTVKFLLAETYLFHSQS